MATAVEKSIFCVSPEIDVFSLPHLKMRQLIVDSTEEVTTANFADNASMQILLQQLSSTLIQFRLHEEIEDKYIMRVLKKRLTGSMLKKLVKHLHANSHISDLIKFVKSLQKEVSYVTSENTLMKYGKELHEALVDFYKEYLPHMVDEEKVFQPLLLEYFSYNELISIKERVLKLHSIQESAIKLQKKEELSVPRFLDEQSKKEESVAASEVVLPPEVILKIFSFLQPREICRCAQVCKTWSSVAMDAELWCVLHPSRWGRGDFTFGRRTSSDDCNCDCEPNYELLQFRDELDDASSSASDSEDTDSEQMKEANILLGISRHLLPNVGKGVKTLVLECSKAITNGLLYRILSQCPNLEYLDVSQTIISDLGLNGLFKDGGGRKLKYLDVSGCTRITDKTLLKLSSFYGKTSRAERKDGCLNCTCSKRSVQSPSHNMNEAKQKHFTKTLECLRLSGCYKITDEGLRYIWDGTFLRFPPPFTILRRSCAQQASSFFICCSLGNHAEVPSLAKQGGLPHLKHLDLSGCLNVSADGLNDLVLTCSRLEAQELFYCDNIMEGPYSDLASGCQNVYCKNRVCCRNKEQ